MRRLQRFGVTAGELERYKMALLRDSAQAAEQAQSVPSADNLDFIMESLALGHTVLDQRQVACSLLPSTTGLICHPSTRHVVVLVYAIENFIYLPSMSLFETGNAPCK